MKQTIPARYEDGVFKPLVPPELTEGQQVTLVLLTPPSGPDKVLELATKVHEGLSREQIDEIEHIALDRRHLLRIDL